MGAIVKQPHKIKLTGKRSVHSKLERMGCELLHDAARILQDHPERGAQSLAAHLEMYGKKLHALARQLES